MAINKQINIDINTNSQETQAEFERLRKSIAKATEEVEDLSKQFGENSKEADEARKSLAGLTNAYDSMAKEATDLGAKFEDVYGEMLPLTGQMGEMEDRLYQLALAGDTTSREYQDLLKSVGEYRKIQIQTDLAVDQAAETMTGKLGLAIEGATSGFAAVQGAMALAGSESEQLEETLLKVQSAMAIQQGVKGMLDYAKSVNLAGKAMKVFNLIVSLNPLTLIITAVVTLIGYLAIFTDALQPIIDGLKAIGDAIGLTDFAGEERRKNIAKQYAAERAEIEKTLEKHKEATKAIEKRYDRELEIARATGKGVAELEKEKLNVLIERLKQEAILEQKKGELAKRELEETKASYKRLNAAQRAFLDDGLKRVEEANKKNLEALNEQILDYENALEVNAINEEKKRKENYKKRLEDFKNYNQQRLNIARQIEDAENRLREDGLEKELEINRDRFRRQREDLEKNEDLLSKERIRLLELSSEEEAKAEKEIRDKYALKQIEDIQKTLDEVKSRKIISGQETFKALQDGLNKEVELRIAAAEKEKQIEAEKAALRKRNQEFAVESTKQSLDLIISLTELFGKKSEKAARRAFNIQKGAQIASATIDTYRNAVSAYGSQFVPVPDPSSPVRGGIAAGIAVAAGLANIAQIASQKFEGGGGGGAVAEPSTAGLEGGAITPQFNVVGDSGINQLAQLQQQPVQAYVVSGEVTSAQALDRNRVKNATL